MANCGAMWREFALTKLNCGAKFYKKIKNLRHISPHFVTFFHCPICGEKWPYVAIRVDLKKSAKYDEMVNMAKCNEMWEYVAQIFLIFLINCYYFLIKQFNFVRPTFRHKTPQFAMWHKNYKWMCSVVSKLYNKILK